MAASTTLTIVLSRKVRKRIAQRAARAADRARRCRNSAIELTRGTLRLAGGRSAALQRHELAEACVPDLPGAVLPHRGSGLLREPGAAELDRVDDLRVVPALNGHRGDRHVHVLRERVVRKSRDEPLELRTVLEHGNTLGDRRLAREELDVRALDLSTRRGGGVGCRSAARPAAAGEGESRDEDKGDPSHRREPRPPAGYAAPGRRNAPRAGRGGRSASARGCGLTNRRRAS